MIKKVIANANRPKSDIYGKIMLRRMNLRHNKMAMWALSQLDYTKARAILDIGCGGGKNIYNHCKLAKNALIYGIDYSEASVKMSQKVNIKAIKNRKVIIKQAGADNIPFKTDFDIITAFETVYYWKNIEDCFKGIYSRLTDNGVFLICNEDCKAEDNGDLLDLLDMTIYTPSELCSILKESGFCDVNVNSHSNGEWFTVICRK